jgi:hypothetical protein
MMKKSFLNIWIVMIISIMGLTVTLPAGENSLLLADKKTNEFSLNDDVPEIASRNINGKNILFSLILPGLGEWVAGEKGRAKIFFGVEVGLWASYFGSREYANVLEQDYFTYAAVHAGVDSRGKGKQYWIDIGNADDIYEFNERRRVQRNLEATYPENEKYSWQWDSEGNRIEYSELRDKQDSWKKVGTFMIGGMVLNRIVSTIDIVRLIRKNKKSSDDNRYSFLHWTYRNNKFQGETVQLNFTWMF